MLHSNSKLLRACHFQILRLIKHQKNWSIGLFLKRENCFSLEKKKREATGPIHTMLCYLSHYKTIRYCYFYFILWHFFHVINFIDYDFTCYVNTVLLILLFDLYLNLFILVIMNPSSFPLTSQILNYPPFPESGRLLLRIVLSPLSRRCIFWIA